MDNIQFVLTILNSPISCMKTPLKFATLFQKSKNTFTKRSIAETLTTQFSSLNFKIGNKQITKKKVTNAL